MTTDKRVKSKIKRIKRVDAVMKKQQAVESRLTDKADAGSIQAEDPMERTFKMSQRKMETEIDVGTKRKLFDFSLPGGPFNLTPSRNGRYMLMTGNGGQVSVMDRHSMEPVCDFTTGEAIVTSSFLSDHTLFAAAQRKYTYIYSSRNGEEVHCLRDHTATTHMDYLPYHYLLVSSGEQGVLRFLDTSTGTLVSKHSTKSGSCQALKANKQSAVTVMGHTTGAVSFWTPSLPEAAMKQLCHYGPITAVDTYGEFGLVTAGQDLKWKIWDIRKPDTEVSKFSCVGRAPTTIDVSVTGKIALGSGPRVQIFNETVFKTNTTKNTYKSNMYLDHMYGGSVVESVKFCPFEDLLLVGSSTGIGSLLVPGSGSAEIDSYAGNPFQTLKQRREHEVKRILEKVKPDTIQLRLK